MPDKRPTEFADRLVFLSTVNADYIDEYGRTSASLFADAWKSLDHFIENTPTEEGKELLRQCARNLHLAYEYLEHGDYRTGAKTVIETEDVFRRSRKYISLSDE